MSEEADTEKMQAITNRNTHTRTLGNLQVASRRRKVVTG